jgi:preprotein translocase subunit SecD
VGESAAGLPSQEDPTTIPAPTTSVPEATTTTVAGEEPAAEPAPTDESGLTPPAEDEAELPVTLADTEGNVYQLGPTFEMDGRQTTGRIVSSASAALETGQWIVKLSMRGGENGIDLFNGLAAECFNRTANCPTGAVAIVLDSVVQSAPNISQPSYERDRLSISGSFDEDGAKDLALVLRYGSLPVELERQDVQTVSASLGEDSLRAGLIAGLVGLALVVLYMIAYYRALGVVVLLGLGVWGALLFTIISWLGETRGLALTLAGVTGIIVSIGVTVDSYVVFFERLKDEVKAGRTLRSSTDRAFRRAFRTILAADVSSFMGAAILWWLTVGSVRGFAFFLGLSTVLDVVVAWFFTRPMVTYLARSRVFTEMPVLGVARGLASTSPVRGGRGRDGDKDTAAKAPAGAGAGR